MALAYHPNRTNARASFDLADPTPAGPKYAAGGLLLGRKADAAPGWDPSRGAEALDELQQIAQRKNDLWMLGALELHRGGCTTRRPRSASWPWRCSRPRRLRRSQGKQPDSRGERGQETAGAQARAPAHRPRRAQAAAARAAHSRGHRRVVTRVLAAPVEEARRVEEDAKKATAARLAPTIALNKRLVRDKMPAWTASGVSGRVLRKHRWCWLFTEAGGLPRRAPDSCVLCESPVSEHKPPEHAQAAAPGADETAKKRVAAPHGEQLARGASGSRRQVQGECGAQALSTRREKLRRDTVPGQAGRQQQRGTSPEHKAKELERQWQRQRTPEHVARAETAKNARVPGQGASGRFGRVQGEEAGAAVRASTGQAPA